MQPTSQSKQRLFVDADVLFAGAAASRQHGASLVLLRLAEITLIDAITCQQVIVEAERDLAAKLPAALPAFRLLVSRSLRVVVDPEPESLELFSGLVDPKDLPILVAAVREECSWLVTFNIRRFQPGHASLRVLLPGELVSHVRMSLASMTR
ncbi:MAG: PIN domain-containing protein [Caldilineaceae bacterium]|nr:PIN domain-containing protein [Caldilineaceae bacterium]